MPDRYDTESRSRRLTQGSMPPKAGSVRQLRERIEDLERRLSELERDIEEARDA